MLLAVAAVLIGLLVLVLSADKFIDGAAASAYHFGMSPLLIGMVIIGFGTSAPEMVVSALSASQGNPGLALGNAFGSNITNIALILGFTALLSPIRVHSQILRKELPMLTLMTAICVALLLDASLSRLDAWILLAVFAVLMGWTIWTGTRQKDDGLGDEVLQEMQEHPVPLSRAMISLVGGLILLVISSRILVWGAVELATAFGVSDLIIGLTIVAIGTSLPELASSIAAVRKGEHDMALGNVIGSNLFNTLAVVGIAGAIHPLALDAEVLSRDFPVMVALTVSLFLFGYGFRGQGRINRLEGSVLLLCYCSYSLYLVSSSFL